MAHAELASPGEPICTWTEASRKFAIYIRPEVIARLGTESWIGFKRVPRRGLEIGGILLGRADSQGDTTTYWIEGSVPVESEHQSGPSYVLSESDFAHLQEALTRNGAASIGLYRSQTRSEQLVPQEPDVRLFGRCVDDRCFDNKDALFLMLGPVPGTAALFIRADGNLKCVHQFPLASSLSSSLALRKRDAAPQAELSVHPAAEIAAAIQDAPPSSVADRGLDHHPPPQNQDSPEEMDNSNVSVQRPDPHRVLKTALKMRFSAGMEPPAQVAPRTSLDAQGKDESGWRIAVRQSLIKFSDACRSRSSGVTRGGWILGAAFSLVLAATVGVLSHSSAHAVTPQAVAPPAAPPPAVVRAPEYLSLRVERAGSSLRILWDRNSSALRDASRVVLHIEDGDSRSDRDLARSELDAGSIIYEPKSSELIFRLDVYSAGPNATGLVQVMNLSARPALAPNLSGAPKFKPATKLEARTELVSARPSAKTSVKTGEKTEERKDEKEEVRPAATRASDRTETSSLDTRETSAATAVERPSPRQSDAVRSAVPASGREPSVHVLTEPVSGSRLGRLVGKVPVLRRLRKPAKFAEAVPVFQAKPAIRLPDHQSLIRPVSVGVKVYVGESGAVQSAEVVEYGKPPDFGLANAALAAARLWTFEPARLEDAPVSSEVILHFNFTP